MTKKKVPDPTPAQRNRYRREYFIRIFQDNNTTPRLPHVAQPTYSQYQLVENNPLEAGKKQGNWLPVKEKNRYGVFPGGKDYVYKVPSGCARYDPQQETHL